jgi:hypothetical protein
MNELEISSQQLSRLTDEAIGLAKTYWASLEERRAYPLTSGKQTTELFSRAWAEEGRGQNVLQDFRLIAEHVRPSTGRFFGYVVGGRTCWGAGRIVRGGDQSERDSVAVSPGGDVDRTRRHRMVGRSSRLRRIHRQPVRRQT